MDRDLLVSGSSGGQIPRCRLCGQFGVGGDAEPGEQGHIPAVRQPALIP